MVFWALDDRRMKLTQREIATLIKARDNLEQANFDNAVAIVNEMIEERRHDPLRRHRKRGGPSSHYGALSSASQSDLPSSAVNNAQLDAEDTRSSCSNCRYVHTEVRQERSAYSRTGKVTITTFYCRRYPPTLLIDGGTGWKGGEWPQVKSDDWCGEYIEKRSK